MIQLLISLLILSAVSALLALFLEIADSYLADYGEKRIRINDEKDLVVKGGSPLLFSLMEQKIFIPSACGGRGTCAYCKVQVHEGGGPVLPTETPYLTAEEIQENVRLSCQVKVKENLRIHIPEELFHVQEFEARVQRLRSLTPDLKEVRFEILSPEEGITFKPGQYIQLYVPPYALTKKLEYRAYSISSSAEEHHALELVITKVEEGAVSTYVHEYMKEGEKVTIVGPYGEFYLRESDRDILFVATGSGLAPIKSILHHMETKKIERKATLFFGDRTRSDLYYLDVLEHLEKMLPNFTFVPTLSRAQDDAEWKGERGRVTDLIRKHILDKAPLEVYICGAPAMVQSCVDLLLLKGTPKEVIFYDKFE
jgi:Na+-transporting NADH:ubiquinone oxidoreductase subunit F